MISDLGSRGIGLSVAASLFSHMEKKTVFSERGSYYFLVYCKDFMGTEMFTKLTLHPDVVVKRRYR